jgi:hypothetical protein
MFDVLLTSPQPPTEQQRQAKSSLERKIDLACAILGQRFHENEIVAARMINPGDAATYADKLALIAKSIKEIEHALRAAVVLCSETA